MSQNEMIGTEPRVPVFDAEQLCAKTLPERIAALQERSVLMQGKRETGRPDTRSPYDPWHTEGYLIRCLVHLHGWAHIEAGVLRRMKRS